MSLFAVDAFQEIVDLSVQVSELVEGIASSSDLQANSIAQVSRALSEIEKVVHETSTSTQESTEVSLQLSHGSTELTDLVNEFVVSDSESAGQALV